MPDRLSAEQYRRFNGIADESDVIDQCREVAKLCGVVLEEVGQRKAKGSGTTIGFPDLCLSVAGWWVPLEGKFKADVSEGQYLLAVWKREQGVDTARITSGQDLADVIGFCMKHPRPRLILPHSLVDYVEGKRR
jgi:hypothetical protein